ncbi:MAG: hypothetical protein KAJ33_08670 [Thermoplasmata archaeon]|nr:hypothetical protein [Thermoplasmata archaeon]
MEEEETMANTEIEHQKVDFYEDEYDVAYSEKPSFNSYKPLLAGNIMFISGMTAIYPIFSGFFSSDLFCLSFTAVFSVILIITIVAGLCAIQKIRHRFALFGAVLTFAMPINVAAFLDSLGIYNMSVYIALLVAIPIFTIYLLVTSDDEFTS